MDIGENLGHILTFKREYIRLWDDNTLSHNGWLLAKEIRPGWNFVVDIGGNTIIILDEQVRDWCTSTVDSGLYIKRGFLHTGDKVIVRYVPKDVGDIYPVFNREMDKFCGKTVTILESFECHCFQTYTIKEDCGKHRWCDCYFEDLVI